MRVVVWHPSWVTETSGVGAVVTQLSAQMARRGHKVWRLHHGRTERLRIAGDEPAPRVRMNLRTPLLPGAVPKGLAGFLVTWPWTQAQLSGFLRREQVDVVNVHYPLAHFIYLAVHRSLQLSKARLVVSLHGSDLCPPAAPPRIELAVGTLLRAADAVTVPSASFLADVLALAPWLRGRARVLHNGVDLATLRAASLSDMTHGRYILSVAAHNEKKGLDVLIRAFARLSAVHPALRLVLVGDGPLRGDLENVASRLGVLERVEFRGTCDRVTVGALLKGCELFVLPSRAEPFGIAAAEAMACGKAVVVSAIGGLTEFVADGETGILVEPGDVEALERAVSRLLEDPELRGRLGQRAASSVERRLSASSLGDRYEALFREITEPGGRHLERSLEPVATGKAPGQE